MIKFLTISFLLSLHFGYSQNILTHTYKGYAMFNQFGIQETEWKNFEYVIPSKTNEYFKFKSGLKYGLLDENLDTLFEPIFDHIEIINQGYYFSFTSPKSSFLLNRFFDTLYHQKDKINIKFEQHHILLTSANKEGAIDFLGEEIVAINYDDIFELNGLLYLRNNDLFGCIDIRKKGLIPTEYSSISEYDDQIIRMKKGNEIHYFLRNGKAIPHTDSTLIYHESTLKIYQNGIGNLYSIPDLEMVIQHDYEDIFLLNNQEFIVKRGSKVGVLNKDHQLIIPTIYNRISSSYQKYNAPVHGVSRKREDSSADFFRIETDSGIGIINRNNEIVIAPLYTYIQKLGKYFEFYENGLRGIFSEQGKILVAPVLNYINIRESSFIIKRGENYGLLNEDLDTILNCIYPHIYRPKTYRNLLEFRTGNKKVLMENNKVLKYGTYSHFTLSKQWVKYYQPNQIMIIYSDGDTVIYPRSKMLNIEGTIEYDPVLPNECFFYKAINPLSGNIDVLSMKNGNIVESNLQIEKDNRLSADIAFRYQDRYIDFMGRKLKVYKELNRLIACESTPFETSLSIAIPKSFSISTFHSTDFERNLNPDGEYRFLTSDYSTYPYIGKRGAGYISSLSEGDLNFKEGDNLVKTKELYQNLQDFKTFEINSKTIFSLLSSNRMIKVKNPKWNLIHIDNPKWRHSFYKSVVSLKEVGNDHLLIRNMNGKFEIRMSNIDSLLISDMVNINIYESDVNSFFECKNNLGTNYLIDKNKKIIIEQYDEILYIGNQYIKYKDKEYTLHLVNDCYFSLF